MNCDKCILSNHFYEIAIYIIFNRYMLIVNTVAIQLKI